MPALEQFSSLVETLYEAAADPQHWSRFVVQFYQAMESTRGVLCARAAEPGLTKVFLEGYTEREEQNYSEYYFQHDEVLAAGLQAIQNEAHWVGPLEEIYSYKKMEASEIYNDYYCDLDMHYASCVMVGATFPYAALGMAAWRSKKDGPFNPEQLQLADLLTPHLKRAFYLQAKLTTLGMEAETFRAGLDAAAIAVLALGAWGQILAASPKAEALLRAREVLHRHPHGNRLHALDAGRDMVLQQLIHQASRVSAIDLCERGGRSVPPGGAMLLPQKGNALALQLQVLPFRGSTASWREVPSVLVCISDPGAVLPGRSKILKDLYELTPLQARLADLLQQGKELKQAADELRLGYDNARFHLKQIFRKTNTHRQTELLRLMLAIPA